MVNNQELPSIDAKTTAFDDTQYTLTYSDGVERHFWHTARNRIIERHLRLLPQGKANKNLNMILDVGCGPGIAVQHLRSSNLNCFGVELGAPDIRPSVRPFIRTSVAATDLEEGFRADIQTILLLDVIEHLDNPQQFILELIAAYPSLEYIILTVPARQELWSNYDDYYGHFRRYDRFDLLDLASLCELDVLSLKYFFNSLYPVMLLQSLRSKGRAIETAPPTGFLPTMFHRMVGVAFSLEERVPGTGYLYGTSLLGVMRVQRDKK